VTDGDDNVRAVEVELSCLDLSSATDLLGRVGFRIETVMPADDPRTVVMQGPGLRVRLVRGMDRPAVLRVVCQDPAAIAGTERALVAGGIRVELEEHAAPVKRGAELYEPYNPAFVVTRSRPEAWHVGRAGMEYRDLLPSRHGGHFIASHIRIKGGGPVPDYVHFHDVRFQMIFCVKGWVRLVYEDQGEPFVLHAGEAVLQPPQIRHRVLECSPGLEVVEIGGPAEHPTHAEHVIRLPTPDLRPDRDFGGQRFVRHNVQPGAGFEAGSLGISEGTRGIADARLRADAPGREERHDQELFFGFVLQGRMSASLGDTTEVLAAGDAFDIPPSHPFRLSDASPDLAWLHVTVCANHG
jgi:quercetin dioxygenase-like cupin family protein